MKLKKIFAIAIAAAMTMGFVATTSYAATQVCFGATITRVGSIGPASPSSGHRIEVQGGTCNFAQFFPLFVHEDLGDAGLAEILTAISLGKTVTLKVPTPVAANDLITAIHIEQ